MAVQNNVSNQAYHEVSNPTLLQQALLHNDLRTQDGTVANQMAETDTAVRKSRKMRETADTFKAPQIEVSAETVIRRVLQKYTNVSDTEKKQLEQLFSKEWNKRSGGNIFIEIAQTEEVSMSGNQSALIARMSQEQADQTQMSNLNTNLEGISNNMQSVAAEENGKQGDASKRVKIAEGLYIGGGSALALGAVLGIAGFMTGNPILMGAGIALGIAGAGCLIGGGVESGIASTDGNQETALSAQITSDSTKGQVVSNVNTLYNQDISMQTTSMQNLNDANSSAASFVSSTARNMQQAQSLGNMY